MESSYNSLLLDFVKKTTVIEVPDEVEFIATNHASVGKAFKRGQLNKSVWDDSFKFCFVRNPWDRLVSVYKYYCSFRYKKNYKSNCLLKTFDVFVSRVIGNGEYRTGLKVRSAQPYFNHVLPQTSWIEEGVNYIGRFERLAEDWKEVCGLMGVKHEALPKVNSVAHFHYSRYYTAGLRKIVDKFYEEEIELFKYRFEDNRYGK
jgi:hypothetical protein